MKSKYGDFLVFIQKQTDKQLFVKAVARFASTNTGYTRTVSLTEGKKRYLISNLYFHAVMLMINKS